jgi:hypothetical protein
MGGCGGTLLSRCLGVLPGVNLLSEINPASVKLFPQFDPLYQDRNWLRLLHASDLDRFAAMDLGQTECFRELIRVFHERAVAAGGHLVLRDYNFVDFVGVPYTSHPSRRLTIYSALPSHIPVRAVAFVRHPADQWSSLCKHQHVRTVLKPAWFSEAYAAFLREVEPMPRFRYEDFVERPAESLRTMCNELALPFDPAFSERFQQFASVTGDFTRQDDPSISLPPPKTFPPEILEEFRSSAAYVRVCRDAGYRLDVGRLFANSAQDSVPCGHEIAKGPLIGIVGNLTA